MDIVRLAELKRSADLDALTGLPNRRAFERRFREPEADGRVAPGALILIDLDGFKAINDEHGHAAGDACLKRAGRGWRRSARAPTSSRASAGMNSPCSCPLQPRRRPCAPSARPSSRARLPVPP